MGHPHLTPDEWLSRLEHQVLSAFRELRGLYEQERAKREELERAYRRLRDLDELKTSFIARAGAELRQPLGLVIGFLEAALGHLKTQGDAESARMVQAALRGAYRLLDYVAPLAAFAELHRRPAAFVEPIPLSRLIQDLIRAHEPRMSEKGIALYVHLPPEAAQAAVDGTYGSYILRTLLDFLLAIRPEGGGMEIRGDVKEPVLLVEILDTHLSLSQELLAWLNEGAVEGLYPQQARSHIHPSALGLVIAKRAAQALGGDLFIRSEGESGTAFSVLLPARPLDIEDQISLLSHAMDHLPHPVGREEGND
ncbi:HAMP domain-containing sensor histidine kinase [Thermoflexus sp.]|uniref:sensor histidine kinase n=1 Tax=Thermoflexus sp. TaxID=1969742 RepID=UPI0017599D06|nr:HAMP domain-containing sensor histidine kinase [Thermoflexus sp.]